MQGVADTSERTALRRTSRGLERYVVEARQTAREIAEQVEKFSQRLNELRSVGREQSEEEAVRSERLLRRTDLQDQELTLALEELRAQNAALVEANTLLEQEHTRYLDLFDNAPDAYVTTDHRGVVREANAAAATMLGMPKPTMPGKLLIAFVSRRDTRVFRGILAESKNGSTTSTFSLNLRARGGAPFPASLSLRRVRLADADAVDLRWTIRRSA